MCGQIWLYIVWCSGEKEKKSIWKWTRYRFFRSIYTWLLYMLCVYTCIHAKVENFIFWYIEIYSTATMHRVNSAFAFTLRPSGQQNLACLFSPKKSNPFKVRIYSIIYYYFFSYWRIFVIVSGCQSKRCSESLARFFFSWM